MEKVKIGIVGAGMMGQMVHIPNLIQLPYCDVIALAEVRQRLGQQVAKKYGIPRVYRSHRELVDDPDVVGVVVSTMDDHHALICIDLLNAGKHVLVEKPLTTNVADGAKMVKAAERTNSILMVDFMKRYDPGVELAKQMVDELRETDELRDIIFVRSQRFGYDWYCNIGEPISTDEPLPLRAKTYPKWLSEDIAESFRSLNDVYAHNVDLLRYLLGDVKEVQFANIGLPDTGTLVVFGFDGFIATLEAGTLSGGYWDEVIKIYFRHGWVEIKTPPPFLMNVPAEVSICKAGIQKQVISSKAAWEWSFRKADEHFLDCIINGWEPRSSGKDALEDLRVMEAVFKKYLQLDK